MPLNPTIDQVLGQKSYPSLPSLPDDLKAEIDVVDILRRPEDVPPIVNEAVELHRGHGYPKAVWMQLGILNEAAARQASEAGLLVVMDRCMQIEHSQRYPSPSCKLTPTLLRERTNPRRSLVTR